MKQEKENQILQLQKKITPKKNLKVNLGIKANLDIKANLVVKVKAKIKVDLAVKKTNWNIVFHLLLPQKNPQIKKSIQKSRKKSK